MENIGEVIELEREAHSSPWSRAAFEAELAHPHGRFLVARLEAQLVAFGALWLLVDEAHIINLAVSQKFRRQGIGRKLVVELLGMAKDAGILCATLEVRAGNEAAIRLYETMGFERTAIRKRYYPDNNEDALVMWCHNLGASV